MIQGKSVEDEKCLASAGTLIVYQVLATLTRNQLAQKYRLNQETVQLLTKVVPDYGD